MRFKNKFICLILVISLLLPVTIVNAKVDNTIKKIRIGDVLKLSSDDSIITDMVIDDYSLFGTKSNGDLIAISKGTTTVRYTELVENYQFKRAVKVSVMDTVGKLSYKKICSCDSVDGLEVYYKVSNDSNIDLCAKVSGRISTRKYGNLKSSSDFSDTVIKVGKKSSVVIKMLYENIDSAELSLTTYTDKLTISNIKSLVASENHEEISSKIKVNKKFSSSSNKLTIKSSSGGISEQVSQDLLIVCYRKKNKSDIIVIPYNITIEPYINNSVSIDIPKGFLVKNIYKKSNVPEVNVYI